MNDWELQLTKGNQLTEGPGTPREYARTGHKVLHGYIVKKQAVYEVGDIMAPSVGYAVWGVEYSVRWYVG